MSVPRYLSEQQPPKFGGPNRFKKGDPRPAGAGRQKGRVNYTTKLLKDAIAGSAEALGMMEPIYRYVTVTRRGKSVRERTDEIIGWRPTGEGGTQGYLMWLGIHYPRTYSVLLGRLLPIQINAKHNGNLTVTEVFKGRDIKSMSLADKMAAMKEVISLTRPLALPNASQGSVIDGEVIEGEFTEAAE